MLPAEAASLSGVVTIDGHPVTGVIVYLEGVEESRSGSFASAPVVIEQRNLTFSPSVIPIVQGSSVVFTNNDSVPHGIYSPSGEAEKFNLGTYSHGEERRMVFSSPGEIILLCHIHPEMEARCSFLRIPTLPRAPLMDGTTCVRFHRESISCGYGDRVSRLRLIRLSFHLLVT